MKKSKLYQKLNQESEEIGFFKKIKSKNFKKMKLPNFNKAIDCISTSSIELFSLQSSYNAKEYLLAVVAEKLLFLLNFNSLF